MARALVLALLATGCVVGEGSGALAGALYVQACNQDHDTACLMVNGDNYGSLAQPCAYNMHPVFFVAQPVDDFTPKPQPINQLSIRVQPNGLNVEEADVLYIGISNEFPVATALGQTLPVNASSNVRASLVLNETCPDALVQIELDGTIAFSTFGTAFRTPVPNDFAIEFEDRLTASFSFQVVDRRASTLGGNGGVSTVPTVGGQLAGNFNFVVRQGRAAQAYP
jgi:hypothetical protein